MSVWSDEFISAYQETSTVKRLTKEIQEANDIKKMQEDVDKAITKMLKRM